MKAEGGLARAWHYEGASEATLDAAHKRWLDAWNLGKQNNARRHLLAIAEVRRDQARSGGPDVAQPAVVHSKRIKQEQADAIARQAIETCGLAEHMPRGQVGMCFLDAGKGTPGGSYAGAGVVVYVKPKSAAVGVNFNVVQGADKTWAGRLHRVIVHELGHHFHDKLLCVGSGRDQVEDWNKRMVAHFQAKGDRVSHYAGTNALEYFAETWSAYHVAPYLKEMDPHGFALVDEAKALMKQHGHTYSGPGGFAHYFSDTNARELVKSLETDFDLDAHDPGVIVDHFDRLAKSVVHGHTRHTAGGLAYVRQFTRQTPDKHEVLGHLKAIARLRHLQAHAPADPLEALAALGEQAALEHAYPPEFQGAIEGAALRVFAPTLDALARDRARKAGEVPTRGPEGHPTGLYGDLVGEANVAALDALRSHGADHRSTLDAHLVGTVKKRLFNRWRNLAGAGPHVGQDLNQDMSNASRHRSELATELGRSPTTEEVAARMGVTPARVDELAPIGTSSLDAPNEHGSTLGDTLQGPADPARLLEDDDYRSRVQSGIHGALDSIPDPRARYLVKLDAGLATPADVEALAEHEDLVSLVPHIHRAMHERDVLGPESFPDDWSIAERAQQLAGGYSEKNHRRNTQALALAKHGGDYHAMLTTPKNKPDGTPRDRVYPSDLIERLGYDKNTASKLIGRAYDAMRAQPSLQTLRDERLSKGLGADTPELALLIFVMGDRPGWES